MKKISLVRGASVATVASMMLMSAAHAQTAPVADAQEANPPSNDQPDIVITASKRSERLQDAPLAVSVISADILKTQNVRSFQDYASLIPNLNQALGSAGGTGVIILRGLYTGSLQVTSTSATYLDEAPFTPNGAYAIGAYSTPDPDLVDVERIEVLKGPQGTLYGASSLGGLVRVIPKNADPAQRGLSGSVQFGGSVAEGGNLGFTARGSAYLTIVPDVLAVSASGFRRRDPGFITNVFSGKDNYGQTDSQGGAFGVVLKPTDSLTLRGRYLTQNTDTIGTLIQDNVQATGTSSFGKRMQSDQAGAHTIAALRLYEAVADLKTDLGTATVIYSHTTNRLDQTSDGTRTYGALLPLFLGGPPPAGFFVRFDVAPTTNADTEEFRFASRKFGPIEFLLGFYHTSQRSLYRTTATDFTATGALLPAPFDNLINADIFDNYKETAGFGNLTVYFTDEIDLTGGIRYTSNSQRGRQVSNGLLLGNPGPKVDMPFTIDENKVLYQVNLRWRPTPTLSLFARTATGYRPGGPNITPDPNFARFTADTTTDYEFGAKGSLLDRRLTYDLSLYYIDWKGVQLTSLTPLGLAVITNGGSAKVKGVEAQASYAVPGGLTIGGSFGYNAAKIRRIDAAPGAFLGARAGDRLPGSPRYTFAGYGDYAFELGQDVKAGLGATVRYQDGITSSFPLSFANPNYTTPGYATLDLRASLKFGNYSVQAAVANVTDANGLTGYATTRLLPGQTNPSQAYLIRPRTFSLTASANF
ncbi:TonB-dependent receptor [Sphingomonas sp.]|uniref:TonB-dependent receptor n=1 Tax=Sphingomonas sp. TaxID=28214 RepID=UPI003D6CF0F9